ncbi:MAG: hypothetical protein IPH60_16520 [Flavobacteriales bacterium]|nr:hypothetical protein [Flavobacteriales bacterium]
MAYLDRECHRTFFRSGDSPIPRRPQRAKHCRNAIADKSSGTFWPAVKGAVLEPMFLLLLATSVIYFVLGETSEAYFMAGTIVLVS